MFKPAKKTQSRLRLALVGPSGSGKTYSALAIATGLGGRIAVIDTEHGSAAKYADRFKFDTATPASFSPDDYIRAIHEAEVAGYAVVVIDSLSHAWAGRGGALEMVDEAARRQKGNSFSAWRDVTPKHMALIDAIVACRCHVVATMRSKVEYVVEDVNGKKTPRKIGMAPVQRDGMEYEFDVVGELDQDHHYVVSKSRCSELSGKVIEKPGAALGQTLAAWLSDGAAAPTPHREPLPPDVEDPIEAVMDLIDAATSNRDLAMAWLRIEQLTPLQKKQVKDAYVAKRRAIGNGSGKEVGHAA